MRKEVIAHKDPKSPISEIFRTLRTNIQFMDTNKKMKTLLITSTFPNEGKSWVTANLAVTFAQAGKRVVLVDADMRKGRQYAIFGVAPKPGLSNYLSQVSIDENENVSEDVSDYIQETEVENLYIIPAGNIPPNPSELLVSAQMIKLLDELKELCDIVIVDGTPCELVADSIILSRIVDSTIVVTAHKTTKKDALERVVKNIQNVNGKLAGVIINKMPISGKKYEQKYYYYGESNNFGNNKKKSKIVKTMPNKSNIKKEMVKRVNVQQNNNVNLTEKTIEKDYKEEKQINESMDLPKALSKKEESENLKSEEIVLERTNDILKQINNYLENEKKNLNK